MYRAPDAAGHDERHEVGRAFCYRCHKPELTCICALVTQVDNQTPVWILQHPRERFHPIGTARIASLGLRRVHVEVRHHHHAGPPAGFPHGAALLYPSAGARPLAEVGATAPPALVVLDGTWPHARTLYRDNPWLHELPRYGLTPPRRSQYRIRREPAPQCVSTIESVVYALSLIEPDTDGLDGLLTAFAAMIDEQIRIQRERGTVSRHAIKRRRFVLDTAPEHVVLVDAEAHSVRSGDGAGAPRRRLVHLCAYRPSTGERFDRVIRNEQPPKALHLGHMGLDEGDLASGIAPRELQRDWSRFLRADDVVVGWSQSTLELLPRALDPSGGLVSAPRVRGLKSAFCNVHREAHGTIEQIFAHTGRTLPKLPLRGRAGRRVAIAHALYELLVEHHAGERGTLGRDGM